MRESLAAAVLFTLLVGCSAKTQPVSVSPGLDVEVYTLSAGQAANTTEARDPATGGAVYLQQPPIITASDVATVGEVETDSANHRPPGLVFRLTSAGGAKMSRATAQPSGQLAIVIGGQLVSIPKILSPVGQEFEISGIDQHFNPIVDALLRRPPKKSP